MPSNPLTFHYQWTYDADGNLSADGDWSFEHDANGRLLGAASADARMEIFRDGRGRPAGAALRGVGTKCSLSRDRKMRKWNGELWGNFRPNYLQVSFPQQWLKFTSKK